VARRLVLYRPATKGSEILAIYDGVVTLSDHDVPVLVELDEDRIRLSASGTEIGEWPTHECLIRHVGNSTYAITAEDETIEFVPSQPGLFAAAVSGRPRTSTSVAMPPEPVSEAKPVANGEAPPPQPLTMGLFYALCLVTAALGLWALVSMVL
jgi:hypothetical protein